MNSESPVDAFWVECRAAVAGLPEHAPEAWAFGATPEHADELLALVLEGIKTATASSVWDYEHAEDPLHERFWREYSEGPRGFAPGMPVACERFRVLYAVDRA